MNITYDLCPNHKQINNLICCHESCLENKIFQCQTCLQDNHKNKQNHEEYVQTLEDFEKKLKPQLDVLKQQSLQTNIDLQKIKDEVDQHVQEVFQNFFKMEQQEIKNLLNQQVSEINTYLQQFKIVDDIFIKIKTKKITIQSLNSHQIKLFHHVQSIQEQDIRNDYEFLKKQASNNIHKNIEQIKLNLQNFCSKGLQKTMQDYNNTIQSLMDDKDQLIKEKDQIKNENILLKKQIDHLHENGTSIHAENQNSNQIIQEQQDQIEILQKQLEQIQDNDFQQQQDIKNYKRQIEIYESKIMILEEEQFNYKTEIDNLNIKYFNIQSELDKQNLFIQQKLNDKINSNQNQDSQLQQDYRNLVDKYAENQKILQNTQIELENQQQQTVDLKIKCNTYCDQINQLKDQITQQQQDQNQKEQQLEQEQRMQLLNNQNDNLQQQLALKNQEIEYMNNKLNSIIQEIEDLKQKIQINNEKLIDKNNQIQNLTNQNLEKDQQIFENQQTISKLKNNIDELNNQIDFSKSEIQKLSASNVLNDQKIVEQLSKQLSIKDDNILQLNETAYLLKVQIQIKDQDIQNLKQELKTMKQEMQQAQSIGEKQKMDIKNTYQQIQFLKSENFQKQSYIKKLEVELDNSNKLIKKYEDQIHDMKKNVAQTNQMMLSQKNQLDILNASVTQKFPMIQSKTDSFNNTKIRFFNPEDNFGIHQNYNIDKFQKKMKVYEKPFNHKSTYEELSQLRQMISLTNYVIVGVCHKLISNIMILCAIDNGQFALKESNSRKIANKGKSNVCWYFVKTKSFGFSNTEDINLDANDNLQGSLRLSWLINGEGGGRVGEIQQNKYQDYVKVIYLVEL